MSLKQEASQKAEWLSSSFNTPFFVVEIIPSAICHTNEIGGSKTPSRYKRGKKKKKGNKNTYRKHTSGKLLPQDSNLSEGFKLKLRCVPSGSSTIDFQVTAENARLSTKN